MAPRRAGGLACLFGLVATALASPAAAQTVNRNLIDRLNAQLLYVALPLTVFVTVIVVYAVVRFRDNDDPRPTTDDAPLEITWTAAIGVILLFVGVSAYTVLANPYVTPFPSSDDGPTADDVEVQVVAYQWDWQFRYPSHDVTTREGAVVPANTSVAFRLHSRDVIHSLFVPGFGVKQDVLPGQTTTARTFVYERGVYRVYCTELCGAGHSRMRTRIVVVSPERYQEWLDENAGQRNVTVDAAAVAAES